MKLIDALFEIVRVEQETKTYGQEKGQRREVLNDETARVEIDSRRLPPEYVETKKGMMA
jgi:hypothetical protein